jgi:hypothetical protein
MLDGLHPDGFTVKGVGCFNDAYVVASHEALDGLTNSMLSNWFCSVHEAFDRWPDTFDVLAIARGAGREFTAGDGTQGTPYILARGVRVISTITLAPDAATQEVLSTHEVTATVVEDGRPQARRPVTFEVVSGPSAGTTARADTDESGTARFRLASAQLGEDEIRATYLDTAGRTRPSNRVRVTWTPASTALRARPAVLDRRALGVHPVELQATLTRGGAPFAGQPVRFSANGKVVCTGTTDAAGAATCSGVVSAVDLVLDGGYVATYEGAELARASSARGELVG